MNRITDPPSETPMNASLTKDLTKNQHPEVHYDYGNMGNAQQ